MDKPANSHAAMTLRRRDRVVVEPVANERQRRDSCRDLLAGVVGWRQGPLERGKIASNLWAIVSSWPRKRSAIRRRQQQSTPELQGKWRRHRGKIAAQAHKT